MQNLQNAINYTNDYALREAAMERGYQRAQQQNLNRLTGQAWNAAPEQRDELLPQIAAIDPKAAEAMETRARTQRNDLQASAINLARAWKSSANATPEQRQAFYSSFLVPAAQKLGLPVPQSYDPDALDRESDALLAMGAGGNSTVQSTRIGADGYYYTVDRNGQWMNSGIKADPRTQLRDQPGVAPGIVDLRTGSVSSLHDGGQQPTPGGQPQPGPVSVGTGVGGVHMNIEGLDPERQRRLAQTLSFMQQAGYPGEEIDAFLQGQLSARRDVGPSAIGSPPQSGPAAMRPATPPAGEVESFGQPQAVVGPDGQQRFVQFGNRGGVREAPGYMPPPKVSAVDRRAFLQAQQKYPQVLNAVRGLDRISNALRGISGAFIDSGPLDQYYARFTPEGQELEAAVGAIQNSVLALTRVPGIGSQSDLEHRAAMLQYPSLDKDPAVNARTMENLRLFMADLKNAYDNVMNDTDPTGQQHGASATHPSGWSIQVEN